VRIVKDKAILRGIINASNCAVDSAMSEADTAQEVLADLGNKLIELGKPAAIQEALPATVDRVLERIVQKKYSGESCSGLTTGVTKLDELTNGISPTEYIIIGARTGHGKSLFVRQIILENAVMGVPCALMNYEMSKENSVECWLSAFSGIEFDHIRKPKFVSATTSWNCLALAPRSSRRCRSRSTTALALNSMNSAPGSGATSCVA
jgi:replicative DNA helicase